MTRSLDWPFTNARAGSVGAVITRRVRHLASGIVACVIVAAALPAGPALADDTAARVGDTVIGEAEFVDLLERQAEYERVHGSGGQPPIELAEGMLDGDVARGHLRNLIVAAAVDEFLASPLYEAPLADVSPASVESLAGDAPINELFERLIDAEARVRAADMPDRTVIAEVYDEHPGSTGVVCVRSAEDPGAESVRCVVLAQARTAGLGGEQFEQLRSGVPGDRVATGGPLTGGEDWVIAGFADAADAFDAVLAPYELDGSAPMLFVFGVLAAGDIEVDDRWGRWDPLTFSVVP